ncbi:hypothetical protein CS542_09525 [Pedobacter sp. IW39]|nr:hypothetical protein CS542_09525 [Pedobacter sp. IW39]
MNSKPVETPAKAIPTQAAPAEASRASVTPNLNSVNKIAPKPNPLGNMAGGTLIPSLTALTNAEGGIVSDEPKFVFGEEKEPFTHEELMVLLERVYTKNIRK